MPIQRKRTHLIARAAVEVLEDRRMLSAGALDTSFGKIRTDIGSSTLDAAFDMALQADGKAVLAGSTFTVTGNSNFALVRYNTDGSLDTTFDGDGKVVTDFADSQGGRADSGRAVKIQADGKIVVAGNSSRGGDSDFALARYNSDGSLDNSFGTGGQLRLDLFSGSNEIATDLVIQPDGKIVVGGWTVAAGGQDQLFTFVRLNSNGSLDGSFGVGGKVTINYDIGGDVLNALALQADGKIVAVGTNPINFTTASGVLVPQQSRFALVRLNTDGSGDGTFGSGGIVTTSFGGSYDEAQAVTIQPDGKIVVAGSAIVGNAKDMAVARYNSNGSLDTSFSGDGKQTIDFSLRSDVAFAVTMQGSQIVLAGASASEVADTSDTDFALARLNANGSLDTNFGTSGKVTTNFIGGSDTAEAVAIDSANRIVAAGSSSPTRSVISDFAITRYLSTDVPKQAPVIVVGPEAGAPPRVRVFNGAGQELANFFAFDPGYLGGVRVASGDVNGDGTLDYVVGAGIGGSTNVRVYDGTTNQIIASPLGSFLAFPGVGGSADQPTSDYYRLAFQGGMNLATGDINGDGLADIVVSVEAGGPPHVKVFSGADGSQIRSFLAYPGVGGDPADPTSVYYTQAFQGGVRLGVGDINGDGRQDILTAAGPGAGPHVKVFDGTQGRSEIRSYFAYDPAYLGGVRIAAGDWNGDGFADVMTAAGIGVAPHVKVIDGRNSTDLSSFFAYDTSFLGGVRLASGDINRDGFADLVTIPGAGAQGLVKVWSGNSGFEPTVAQSFLAWDPSYTGGSYIGVGQIA